ncbi:MAG: TIR domain-containing protein [Limnohabitans sp.]|nr:TIR domain-containing protein [Limnohabitans sp.]
MDYKYDVTLSFAGEDREYVEKVANTLHENGVKVFYDKFEEVDLWGKDLGLHFDYVYRKGAKYCVPFISEHYKKKIWTNHEIRTAISRAIETNVEYILPTRFDDTEIDGIRPTIGFLDLRKISAEKLAHLIIKKLEKEPTVPLQEQQQEDVETVYLGIKSLAGAMSYNYRGLGLGISFTNTNKEHRYINQPYFELSDKLEGIGSKTFYLVEKLDNIEFPIKLEYGQSFNVTYLLKTGTIDIWKKLPKDATIQAFVTSSVGEKFKSNKHETEKIIQVFNEKGIS